MNKKHKRIIFVTIILILVFVNFNILYGYNAYINQDMFENLDRAMDEVENIRDGYMAIMVIGQVKVPDSPSNIQLLTRKYELTERLFLGHTGYQWNDILRTYTNLRDLSHKSELSESDREYIDVVYEHLTEVLASYHSAYRDVVVYDSFHEEKYGKELYKSFIAKVDKINNYEFGQLSDYDVKIEAVSNLKSEPILNRETIKRKITHADILSISMGKRRDRYYVDILYKYEKYSLKFDIYTGECVHYGLTH